MAKGCAVTAVLICAAIWAPRAAEAGALVTVRFVYYSNPNGWDANGNDCDPAGNPCDPLFTITVTIPDSPPSQVTTDRASDQNSVSFGNKIVNINNPLLYYPDNYKGRLTVQVKVDDYDPVGSWDYMGTFSYTYLDTPVSNSGAPTVKEVQLKDDGRSGATLVLQLSVVCGLTYYGANCGNRCAPANDDALGHFTCDSSGNRVCLPSYDAASSCLKTYCASQTPCKNGGNCGNLDAGFVCSCVGLWGGPTCESPVSACDSGGEPCRNNGTCISGTGASGCSCPASYTGPYCTQDVNECLASPPVCQHSSTCENQPGTYSCRCQVGWQGKNCSEDVDECAASAPSSSGTCQNGGLCVNLPGNFSCVCPKGFRGGLCQLDVDECADNSSNNCRQPTELCQNLQGGFVCLCRAGWAGANCSVQYLTQDEANAAAEGRLLVGILVPTLILALAAAAAAGYCCLYRRKKPRTPVWLRRLGLGGGGAGSQARGATGGSSSAFTENATYSCARPESGVYEDAEAQYTKVRPPPHDDGYESVGRESGPSAPPPPPLPPKRSIVPSEQQAQQQQQQQQQQLQDSCASANYSLMSEAVSSSGAGQLDGYANGGDGPQKTAKSTPV